MGGGNGAAAPLHSPVWERHSHATVALPVSAGRTRQREWLFLTQVKILFLERFAPATPRPCGLRAPAASVPHFPFCSHTFWRRLPLSSSLIDLQTACNYL